MRAGRSFSGTPSPFPCLSIAITCTAYMRSRLLLARTPYSMIRRISSAASSVNARVFTHAIQEPIVQRHRLYDSVKAIDVPLDQTPRASARSPTGSHNEAAPAMEMTRRCGYRRVGQRPPAFS
jgi:hypothetical protein